MPLGRNGKLNEMKICSLIATSKKKWDACHNIYAETELLVSAGVIYNPIIYVYQCHITFYDFPPQSILLIAHSA